MKFERKVIANLSENTLLYFSALRLEYADSNNAVASFPWLHALAIGYSPAYLSENADGIRRDWPRIPLPNTKNALLASADLGKQVAALLDTEQGVSGVTTGRIRPELRVLGNLAKLTGKHIDPAAGDLNITAGWGHEGKQGVTMPGKGKSVEREYTPEETAAINEGAKALGLSAEEAFARLGRSALDIHLNDSVYWSGVPVNVWEYYIGGYQVIKKWLSYREAKLLDRGLTPDEARYVTEMTRRIAAIVLLGPALDANYQAIKADCYPWPGK